MKRRLRVMGGIFLNIERGVSVVLKLGQGMIERYSEGMDKKAANKKMKDIRKLYIQLRVYLQLRVALFWLITDWDLIQLFYYSIFLTVSNHS